MKVTKGFCQRISGQRESLPSPFLRCTQRDGVLSFALHQGNQAGCPRPRGASRSCRCRRFPRRRWARNRLGSKELLAWLLVGVTTGLQARQRWQGVRREIAPGLAINPSQTDRVVLL